MQIVAREDARSQGLKRFFTGEPCRNQHIAERHISGGHCVECMKARSDAWRANHPKETRERSASYRAAHPEKVRKADAKWRAANPQKHSAKLKAWRAKNPNKNRSYAAERRAAKLQRTPPWADIKAIRAFYDACPEGHHVDHHYPLRSKICSGLHVLENLRYLPAYENLSKGNKMPTD